MRVDQGPDGPGTVTNASHGIIPTRIESSAGVPIAGPEDRTPSGEPGILLRLDGWRIGDGEPAGVLLRLDSFLAAVVIGAIFTAANQHGDAFRAQLYAHLEEVLDQAGAVQ